ncbi:glycosyl transferase family 2 [Leptolyngbya sp. BL0902]|uniref:Gfo/Idh/MocA family protein n=1 Tax=Leptolyngbya sp. BL0902 TaxID=1115757 RepID=UPI00193508F2|nr:Gfo/Idh/MocA family oxidoreductase [Leptolyngbya sp. BL0902]QQE65100.1 glycosyl transferase family 2 [Leptolyngbya sp. BL0902]
MAINIGMVGTGFVAQRRAEALAVDGRGRLVAVTGHHPEDTQTFAQTHRATAVADWPSLISWPDLEVIIVSHVNCDHGMVVRAALEAGRHVVVEYPLALDWREAERLVTLAQQQQRLLHVEHIEVLSGNHQALKANLSALGIPLHVRYVTLSPQRPAPDRWTYQPDLFGFPLVGALSRVHRLVDAFGPVAQVSGQNQYDGWSENPDTLPRYRTNLCAAQITFQSGVQGELLYGKGEAIWQATRRLEVIGTQGQIHIDGDTGQVITAEGTTPLEIGSRRGLLAADTRAVLDHLCQGTPLYLTPAESVYSLRVANAIATAAQTGQVVKL